MFEGLKHPMIPGLITDDMFKGIKRCILEEQYIKRYSWNKDQGVLLICLKVNMSPSIPVINGR